MKAIGCLWRTFCLVALWSSAQYAAASTPEKFNAQWQGDCCRPGQKKASSLLQTYDRSPAFLLLMFLCCHFSPCGLFWLALLHCSPGFITDCLVRQHLLHNHQLPPHKHSCHSSRCLFSPPSRRWIDVWRQGHLTAAGRWAVMLLCDGEQEAWGCSRVNTSGGTLSLAGSSTNGLNTHRWRDSELISVWICSKIDSWF